MTEAAGQRETTHWLWWVGALFFAVVYVVLLLLSFSFHHGERYEQRPILTVVVLLVFASLVYFGFAVGALRKAPPLWFALASSCVFRLLMAFSFPIQEDDAYRYLWDGKVVANGLDPYLFSPEELESDTADSARAPYRELMQRSVGNEQVFQRINNRVYPTIYPPVLQGIFAVPAWFLGDDLSVYTQFSLFRLTFVFFDVALLLVLAALLREVRRDKQVGHKQRPAWPSGLVLLYGWCPLVVKEIANSGHLDSVPTFFLAVSLFFILLSRRSPSWSWQLLFGLAFGFAVGAKVYAIVLLPLLMRFVGLRKSAWLIGGVAVVVFLGSLTYLDGAARRDEVMKIFALWWDNNAAIYYWLEQAAVALFASGAVDGVAAWIQDATMIEVDPAAVVARVVGAAIAACVVTLLCLRTNALTRGDALLQRCFVALLVLLLVGPIGFPWYFLPCLFLLPFSRMYSAILLPGLLMVYYLRFWYLYQYDVLGFEDEDSAVEFFHRTVVTLEFALFYAALGYEVIRGKVWRRQSAS